MRSHVWPKPYSSHEIRGLSMKTYTYTKGQIISGNSIPEDIRHLLVKASSAHWVAPYGDHIEAYKFWQSVSIEVRNPEIIISFIKGDNISKLENKLLSISGDTFCAPNHEEDLDKLISIGKSVNKKDIYVMKGRDSQCHENAARCWDANREQSSIMTGYVLDDGVWRQHSWVLDSNGTIVETTFIREAYFGITLTPEEANAFYFDNAW